MKEIEEEVFKLKDKLDSEQLSFEHIYEKILLKNSKRSTFKPSLRFVFALSSIAIFVSILAIAFASIGFNSGRGEISLEDKIIHHEFVNQMQRYQVIKNYDSFEEMKSSIDGIYSNDDFYNICYFKPTDKYEYLHKEFSLMALNDGFRNDSLIILESFEIKIDNSHLLMNCYFAPVIKLNNNNLRIVVDEDQEKCNAQIFTTSLMANVEYNIRVGSNWINDYINNEIIKN